MEVTTVRLKSVMLLISLAYLTFFLPVMTVAYSPFWYKINCGFHGRCAVAGEEKASQGIDELVAYFRHTRSGLTAPFWTWKEKNHLKEVRSMLDTMTIFCIPALLILVFSFEIRRARRSAVVIMIAVSSLFLVLPFFKFFWRHVFHPLLFSNRNWLNTPLDFSYYILPRVFFQYTVVLIVAMTILVNLGIYAALTVWAKRRKYVISGDQQTSTCNSAAPRHP